MCSSGDRRRSQSTAGPTCWLLGSPARDACPHAATQGPGPKLRRSRQEPPTRPSPRGLCPLPSARPEQGKDGAEISTDGGDRHTARGHHRGPPLEGEGGFMGTWPGPQPHYPGWGCHKDWGLPGPPGPGKSLNLAQLKHGTSVTSMPVLPLACCPPQGAPLPFPEGARGGMEGLSAGSSLQL